MLGGKSLLLLPLLLLAGCGTSAPVMHTHHIVERPLLAPGTTTLSPQDTTLSPQEQCSTQHTGCAKYLLGIVNGHRVAAGLPPYAMDWGLSFNTSSCKGAMAHARAMLASGSIWHTNPAYPANSFPTDFCCQSWTSIGQNVGMAQSSDESQAIATIDRMMFAEGPGGGHFQNLMSRTFTRVGFGVAWNGNSAWIVEDMSQ